MFKYALNLVFRRKLRTFLTSLGILIAVMLMSFILFGMSDLETLIVNQFTSQFKPNELSVGNTDFFSGMGSALSAPTKNEEEQEEVILNNEKLEIVRGIDGVEEVYPLLLISTLDLYFEDDSTVYPRAFPMASNIPGDHHIYKDHLVGEDFVLGDYEVFVSDFIPTFYEVSNEDIIGRKIYLRSSSSGIFGVPTKSSMQKEYMFEIVGVVDSGPDVMFMNLSTGLEILSDLGGFESTQEYIDEVGYYQYWLSTDIEKTSDIEEYIVDELGLSVISTETLMGFVSTITGGLTIALIMFGTISAVIASIGIINTMIMSIYEQTKEIGIVKAIGASNLQVLVIFLIQSAIIGLFGGLMGLGITYLLMRVSDPFIVELLLDQGFDLENFFNFRFDYAIYITLGSILIGIIAGIYPSYKASRLDPVNALRYE